LLRQRAREPDPAILAPAVTVLGRHYAHDPGVCSLLITVAREDSDLGVRRAAVHELGGAPADRSEVRALLTTLIEDADWSVRRSAVHALGRHLDADPAIRRLFIEQARRATDPDLHCLFTQALSWLPGAGPDDFPDPRRP
jgi:HEAT repeat protein